MMLTYLQMYPETKAAVQRYQPADRCALYEAMMDFAFDGVEPCWAENDLKWFIWESLKQAVTRSEEAKKRKQDAGRASAEQRNASRSNTAQQKPTEVNRSQQAATERNSEAEAEAEADTEADTEAEADTENKRRKRRFAPPAREEVEAYIREKGYRVDVDRWMAHYESNGWMVGKNKMKDWKAAVRTWVSNGVESSSYRKTVAAQQYTQRDYSQLEEHNDLMDLFKEDAG